MGVQLSLRLALAVVAGVLLVVASAALVYLNYPPTASAAAEASRGAAPFEAAVSAASGWRWVEVSGRLVGVGLWRGGCLLRVAAPGGVEVVVVPGWAPWRAGGHAGDPCGLAGRHLGGRVEVLGVLHPTPRGPVVVAYRLVVDGVEVEWGATPVPPGHHPHHWGPHRGGWGPP